MPQPESGLSKSELEEIVKAALADIPQSQPGITSAETEQIARGVVASIPPKSSPAEYTKFFVDNAISRYETQGLDATLAHYNREESIDGQWYVFIIDENDLVIGHPDAHRLGLDLKGWVSLDATGYTTSARTCSRQLRRASGCPTCTRTRRAAASEPTTPARWSRSTYGW